MRSSKHSGGVLCTFHNEELRDSVSLMFKSWFRDDGLIGFTPVDFSPSDEGDYKSVVAEEDGDGDGEGEISEI
jgi:hypothetical protein